MTLEEFIASSFPFCKPKAAKAPTVPRRQDWSLAHVGSWEGLRAPRSQLRFGPPAGDTVASDRSMRSWEGESEKVLGDLGGPSSTVLLLPPYKTFWVSLFK